jgi:hypothetical protein
MEVSAQLHAWPPYPRYPWIWSWGGGHRCLDGVAKMKPVHLPKTLPVVEQCTACRCVCTAGLTSRTHCRWEDKGLKWNRKLEEQWPPLTFIRTWAEWSFAEDRNKYAITLGIKVSRRNAPQLWSGTGCRCCTQQCGSLVQKPPMPSVCRPAN